MDPPNLKLVEKKKNEKEIKTLLATGVKHTLPELRAIAQPSISDYYLDKWLREAGAPHIKLKGKTRSRSQQAEPAPAPPSNAGLAWIAGGLGGGLGIVGLALNCIYAYQLGATPWQAWINVATGGLIDLISMFGLALTFALPWRHRAIAMLLWLFAVGYSFLAAVGFFSTLLDDNARKGSATDQYRADLTAQIEQATAELAALRDPKQINENINAEINTVSTMYPQSWRSSDGCTKISTSWQCAKLKSLWDEKDHEAKTRAPLTAKIERLTEARHALPNVSGKDSIGATVDVITRGQIGSQGATLYRNVIPALLLAFSGLLLAYSRELRILTWSRKNTEQKRD